MMSTLLTSISEVYNSNNNNNNTKIYIARIVTHQAYISEDSNNINTLFTARYFIYGIQLIVMFGIKLREELSQ